MTVSATPWGARALLSLVLLLCVARLSAAPAPTEWAWVQELTVSAAGVHRVTVPPEILGQTRAEQPDLRLLGPDDQWVGFALLRHADLPRVTPRTLEVVPIQKPDHTAIECSWSEALALTEIEVQSPAREFLKPAILEVQRGDGTWERLAENRVLFRTTTGEERTRLPVQGREVRGLRLQLGDSSTPAIPVTGLVLHPQTEGDRGTEQLTVVPRVAEKGVGETRWALDLGYAQRTLLGLQVEIAEPLYDRAARLVTRDVVDGEIVERTLLAGSLRRLVLPGGVSYDRSELTGGCVAPSREVELVVAGDEAQALTVQKVQFRLAAPSLAFMAPRPGVYRLLAGHATATPPRYDVEAFRGEWVRLPVSAGTWGSVYSNPGYTPAALSAEVPAYAGEFSAQGWTGRRSVTVQAPGAQVLEADLALLAAVRGELGLVRLVKGGRQIPFVVERSERRQRVELTPEALVEDVPLRVSRWRLQLPADGAPVRALSLWSEAPLFDRSVRLIARGKDNRGETWGREVARTSWRRAGSEASGKLTFELDGVALTQELWVEIEQGDNPPIPLSRVEVVYPVRRLHFRADETGAVELFYGHRTAGVARYDLPLVAGRLLERTGTAALLAPAVEKPAVTVTSFSSRWGQWIFWGVLGLVVAVLLLLVGKLLPKAPPPPV